MKEKIKNRLNKEVIWRIIMLFIIFLFGYLMGGNVIYFPLLVYIYFGYILYFKEKNNVDKKSFKVYWIIFILLILLNFAGKTGLSLTDYYFLYTLGASILATILIWLYSIKHWLTQDKLSNKSFGIVAFLSIQGILRSLIVLLLLLFNL
jgi:hypothetical protein